MSEQNMSILQKFGKEETTYNLLLNKSANSIRVALPGIIESVNIEEQTVTVQPTIMEQIKDIDGKLADVKLPVLQDVPVIFPRCGGFSLTLPISIGDECLVIFSDMCIDAWWASGGIQKQEEIRRHDLSDAFAILGPWSQTKKVSNFSTTKAKLVHEASGNGVEVSNVGANLVGAVSVNGQSLSEYILSIAAAADHTHP